MEKAHAVELPGEPISHQQTGAQAPHPSPPIQHQQPHPTGGLSSPVVSPASPAPAYTPFSSPPSTNHAIPPQSGSAPQGYPGAASPEMHHTPPVYQTPPPQGMPYQAPPMNAAFQTPSPSGQPQVMYDANGQPMMYQQSPGGHYPPQQQYFQQPMPGHPMPGQPQPGMPMHSPPVQSPAPQPGMAHGQAPPAQPAKTGGVQYQNATPIAALGRGAAPVDCPACGQRAMTQVSYEIGNSTHAWALGICCLTCLGCIPYLMNSLKDVQHKCGRCGVLLATWHRSGSTEVHIHS